RQNNARLDELASKITALRGVTVDIYDNARDQRLLDQNVASYSALLPSIIPNRNTRANYMCVARPMHLPPYPPPSKAQQAGYDIWRTTPRGCRSLGWRRY
ncbi:hypothetical protein L211DRAFT_775515, partial [Terfezia boudieri ATCC MYA-4762]